jgi:hypothetical protein
MGYKNMCQYCKNKNEIIAETRIDYSLNTFQGLLEQGYDKATWRKSSSEYSQCDICSQLDGREWNLQEFINNTQYEASIFSKSHVNCLCEIEVSNPQGVIIRVNYLGVI